MADVRRKKFDNRENWVVFRECFRGEINANGKHVAEENTRKDSRRREWKESSFPRCKKRLYAGLNFDTFSG